MNMMGSEKSVTIKKSENDGFVIETCTPRKPTEKDKYPGSEYKTYIAKDAEEMAKLVAGFFGGGAEKELAMSQDAGEMEDDMAENPKKWKKVAEY